MIERRQDRFRKREALASLSRWLGLAFHAVAVVLLLLLTVSYLVSDRHWLGAAWGIWPPWFWAPALAVLVVLGHRPGRARATIALVAATALFCLVFSEGLLVLRRQSPVARHVFREAHKRVWGNPADPNVLPSRQGFPLRVVSWNVNSLPGGAGAALARLADHRPDICFIQEVWGGERDLPREAVETHLPGYSWLAEPDCGLLSRYPAGAREPVDLQWIRAQVVEINLPASRTVTCINAHLPLLPLRLAVHKRGVRDETRQAVQARATMVKRLADAVRSHLGRDPVIVAGDWNVPARAGSLKPLRALLDDAFRLGGSEWGNTMTNEFPVSRIDAIFLSDDFDVAYCASHPSPPSDHRLVEAELWLKPNE